MRTIYSNIQAMEMMMRYRQGLLFV